MRGVAGTTVEQTMKTPDYPSSAYAWYVVVVLYLGYTLSFVDRAIIAYLVTPIREDLHINDFQFSLIQGLAFTVFYATMGIPLGGLRTAGAGVISLPSGLHYGAA
jgi:hypothetical protein